MERHLRIAAILLLTLAGVNLGTFLLAYYFGNAAQLVDFSRSSNEFFRSTPLLSFVAFGTLVYGLALVAPLVVAGLGLLRVRSWSPGVATLVATFTLLCLPFGPLVGGYALWVLLAEETNLIFSYQSKSERSIFKSR